MANSSTDERFSLPIRPFMSGVTYKSLGEVPKECVLCTVTFTKGVWKVKFPSSACPIHWKYTRMQMQQTSLHFQAARQSESEASEW